MNITAFVQESYVVVDFCNGCVHNMFTRDNDGSFCWGCERGYSSCNNEKLPFVTLLMFTCKTFDELFEYNLRMTDK